VTSSVLWLTANIEADPHSGSAIRAHRLIGALARCVPVDVITLNAPDGPALAATTGARHVTVRALDAHPWRTRFLAARNRWPRPWAAFWNDEVAADIAVGAAAGALVVLDQGYLAPYRPPTGRYVLHLHNADGQFAREGPWPRRPGHLVGRAWDSHYWPRREREAAADPRATVVTVSALDADRVGRADALVVPNGADLPGPVSVPPGGSLLFVGSLDYLPNQIALRWWADHIAPRLPAALPTLTVVGRHPEALRPSALAASLDLRGRVESMDSSLRAASVVVIPLRHGSGTRLKLLEAMAWGRPVVATTKAVEGVPVVDGTHVLVRDDAATFAAAVNDLWSDHDAAEALGDRARVFAAGYDWRDIGARFADAILRDQHGGG